MRNEELILSEIQQIHRTVKNIDSKLQDIAEKSRILNNMIRYELIPRLNRLTQDS